MGLIVLCGVLDFLICFNYIEKLVFKFFFYLVLIGFCINVLKICGLLNVNKG